VETKEQEEIKELIRLCDRFDVFEYERMVTCEMVVQITRINPERKRKKMRFLFLRLWVGSILYVVGWTLLWIAHITDSKVDRVK